MRNQKNILKRLFETMLGEKECKNKCGNKRRYCSAYCEECSKKYEK